MPIASKTIINMSFLALPSVKFERFSDIATKAAADAVHMVFSYVMTKCNEFVKFVQCPGKLYDE